MTPDILAKACCKLSCVVFLGHTAEVCGWSFWDGVQYGPSRQRSPAGHQIHVWFPGWASRQATDHRPGRTAHLEEQLVRYQALPVFDLIFCSICLDCFEDLLGCQFSSICFGNAAHSQSNWKIMYFSAIQDKPQSLKSFLDVIRFYYISLFLSKPAFLCGFGLTW